jgi:hypothetical protein
MSEPMRKILESKATTRKRLARCPFLKSEAARQPARPRPRHTPTVRSSGGKFILVDRILAAKARDAAADYGLTPKRTRGVAPGW